MSHPLCVRQASCAPVPSDRGCARCPGIQGAAPGKEPPGPAGGSARGVRVRKGVATRRKHPCTGVSEKIFSHFGGWFFRGRFAKGLQLAERTLALFLWDFRDNFLTFWRVETFGVVNAVIFTLLASRRMRGLLHAAPGGHRGLRSNTGVEGLFYLRRGWNYILVKRGKKRLQRVCLAEGWVATASLHVKVASSVNSLFWGIIFAVRPLNRVALRMCAERRFE